jgi:hypothetical protein
VGLWRERAAERDACAGAPEVIRRFGALLAGVTIVCCTIVTSVGVPAAHASGGCSGTSGVTVVVDLSAFGQGIHVGCAAGTPASGLDALHSAGFSTAPVPKYGTAFVCRIDGEPDTSHESCTNTPPANAYWAYWHAAAGASSWSYESTEADHTHPAAGSVEGWAFGQSAQPGVAPNQATTPPPTSPPPPPPTSSPPHTTNPPVTKGGNPSAPGATSPRTDPNAPPATDANGNPVPTTRPASTTGPDATDNSGTKQHGKTSTTTAVTPALINQQASGPFVRIHGDSGSPWPTIVTIIVLVTAAAGTAVGLQRKWRRAASETS